jgi:hypothetical protein
VWRLLAIYAPVLFSLFSFTAELMVIGGARLIFGGTYIDPFAQYEAIMPERPTTALEQYPCQYERVFERDPQPTICRVHPTDSIFTEVIVYFHSDRIWRVVFKPQGLRFGELVQRWGTPFTRAISGHSLHMQWGMTVYTIIPLSDTKGHLSYLQPVYNPIVVENRGYIPHSSGK